MATIAQTLSDDHKRCDALFAQCEAAVLEQRWVDAAVCHAQFCRAVDAHLTAEESVLFPAFESAVGEQAGPTQVMRQEHAQMREILEQMTQAAWQRQREAYAELGEMLLILIQQHNLKEENIVYPMCDRSLAQKVDEITARLAKLLEPE
ncbi:MAG TPA: hemerythrin domain-containing protein [Terriglobales bacterium]|nr:hemerythrin domain-containing protein [Terriglobales bacterium]